MNGPPPPLLLVEDDADDIMLFEIALDACGGVVPLHVARDGEDALAWLGRRGSAELPLPALVVLDLKLPRQSGLLVLEAIRLGPVTRDLPVVILSSSEEVPDVARAHALRVDAYFVKPVGVDRLVDIVREIVARWESAAGGEALRRR